MCCQCDDDDDECDIHRPTKFDITKFDITGPRAQTGNRLLHQSGLDW